MARTFSMVLALLLSACVAMGDSNSFVDGVEVVDKRYLGAPGSPYSGAEISARRLGGSEVDAAMEDLRLQLAAMALNAGWRYMDVSGELVSDAKGAASPRYGASPSGLGTILGNAITKPIRSDRGLFASVKFTDRPGPRTVDALELYNRLGAKLLDDFEPETAPAPTKSGYEIERGSEW